MAKEVLETFAAAKRAADALAGGGGKAAADRCVEALGRLRRLPVTVDGLFAAGAVKSVRGLTKNPDEKIKAVASELLKSWETSRAPRNPSRNGSRNPSNAGVLNGKKSSSGPKPSPICKAAHREILAEAFSRVSKETRESKRDEVRKMLGQVDACDPILAAVTVGSALSAAAARKYRSVMFNLKDGKNPDFRRRVLLGQIDPEDLGDLTPEEMASDERKRENRLIREKALWHCCPNASQEASKATTDQFTCGRCRQQKTTYYQLQTRSADEPMTTYVTCVNCDNRWKFC